MPFSHPRTALLAVLATGACLPQAGNQASLTPMVRRVSADTVAVRSAPGIQLAAFAVVSGESGRQLRFLGTSDGAAVIVLARRAPGVTTPLPTVSGTRLPWAFSDNCVPRVGPPDENGYSRVTYSCTQLLPSDPVWRGPTDNVEGPPPIILSGYVVIVASNSHLSSLRWQALADSLGTTGTLSGAPKRIGTLAFDGDPKARWGATLAWLSNPGGVADIHWVEAP